MLNAQLAKTTTIRELVGAFNQAAETVRRTYSELIEAEERLNVVFGNGASVSRIRIEAVSQYDRGRTNFSADECIAKMTRDAWRVIVDRLEIQKVMSVARRTDLEKELDKGDLPEITYANVEAFVYRYAQEIPDLIREYAKEVFDFLRPRINSRKSAYKRNNPVVVGERVILPYWIDSRVYTSTIRLNFHYCKEADALERLFKALDGKGATSPSWDSDLARAITQSPEGQGSTEYFEFRACKNQSLHLRFKRLDLVAKLNAMAGGLNFPPATPEEA